MPSNHQGLSMTSREQIIVDLLLVVSAHEEQGHGMHEKCMCTEENKISTSKSKGRTTRYKTKFMNCLLSSASINIYVFL